MDPTVRGPETTADTAWLSWLRVFAICGVVAIHTVGPTAARPHARETLRGQLAILIDIGAVFAVPVFVMVSGALLLDPARYHGAGAFLRKRAGRLVAPIIVWHLWYAALVVLVKHQDVGTRTLVGRALSGHLYGALYFFWIVAGLAVVTPVLVPFVRDHGRRGALVAGLVGCSIPALTMATLRLREAPVAFADSAFTWWFPYVGMFFLGYGVRGVVLRRQALVLAVLGTVGLGLLLAWQWRNPDAPDWMDTVSPVGYYSATSIAYAALLFLSFQGLFARSGPLRAAAGPRATRWGRLLGDATLGVFVVHLTVVYVVVRSGLGGPKPWTATTHDLGLRLLVVLAATWLIVLVLRRVPYVRALL